MQRQGKKAGKNCLRTDVVSKTIIRTLKRFYIDLINKVCRDNRIRPDTSPKELLRIIRDVASNKFERHLALNGQSISIDDIENFIYILYDPDEAIIT